MSEEGEVGAAIDGVCQVCTALAAAKYRCPACSTQSCSLDCIRQHKSTSACTGKRARSCGTFIPASQLNEEVLLDDQRLLEEASASVQASASRAKQPKASRRLGDLQKQCRERNIHLALMPEGMNRPQRNRSRLLRDNNILWTIEWIFIDGDTPDHPVHMKIDQLGTYSRAPALYSTALETDDIGTCYAKLPSESVLAISDVQLLLKMEADRAADHQNTFGCVDTSPTKRLWPIHSIQTPLNLLLANRTIIEFPTIYIYPRKP